MSDRANEFKGDYGLLSHQNCKVSVHIVKYSFLRSKHFGRILPMIAVSFFVHDCALPILNIITTLNIFQVNNRPWIYLQIVSKGWRGEKWATFFLSWEPTPIQYTVCIIDNKTFPTLLLSHTGETWGHSNHFHIFLRSPLCSMCWGKSYTMEMGSEYFGILSNYLGSTKDNLYGKKEKKKILSSKFLCLSFLLLFIFQFNQRKAISERVTEGERSVDEVKCESVWGRGMTAALALLLGRKQHFLTAWVESNISTINNLVSPEVKRKTLIILTIFHSQEVPKGTMKGMITDAF